MESFLRLLVVRNKVLLREGRRDELSRPAWWVLDCFDFGIILLNIIEHSPHYIRTHPKPYHTTPNFIRRTRSRSCSDVFSHCLLSMYSWLLFLLFLGSGVR